MSRGFFSRVLPAVLIAVSTLAMTAVSYDASAKRLGGGGSVGRQSGNVMQRSATPPAAAPSSIPGRSAAAPAAAGAAAGTAAAATRSGASRWLGPIAGIAAGLGLAALFSSMGLGGALAEFMGSFLLIGLLAFAAIFIFRKLRGAKPAGAQPAFQGAGAQKTGGFDPIGDRRAEQANNLQREAAPAAAAASSYQPAGNGLPAGTSEVSAGATWAIPADFDTAAFLQQAKRHFVELQKIWDRGDTGALRDYVTDDMLAELTQQMSQRTGANVTEVVLLNAELMGIETLSDGYLASVRFSGMIREDVGAEATRLEEVWNLYKPTNGGGWLLAGLQQL
jgi:predicted lipid-binding transport protein (Tim44 family)